MAKRPRRPRPVTRAELRAISQQLARILALLEVNAGHIDGLRKDTDATVRRCAELQLDIDRLKSSFTNTYAPHAP